jgi:hypothetical protein
MIFLFQTKSVTVQIPYDKINVLEYVQRVGRRYAEAVLLSPVFLLSKTRKHHLTVEFKDDRGKRRVFVDRFSCVETASQMRDMILSGLQNAKLFVVTKNPDRADAFLRESAEDLVFTDEHSSSDSIHAQANLSCGSSYSGPTNGHEQTNRSQGVGFGDSESSRTLERRHEAVAAIRVVNKRRDVIWSTTQKSVGVSFVVPAPMWPTKSSKNWSKITIGARKLK